MTPCPNAVFSAIEVMAAPLDSGGASAGALSADERARAARFRHERDRRRFIAARGRLRELLAVRLGVDPRDVELAYGRHGKPELAPRYARSGWRFNVSHSADLALFVFARGREVGVDVEALEALSEADELAARFLSPREHQAYRALARGDRPLGFLRCWTRKEAYAKALGEGLRMPLAGFDLSAAPSGWGLESFSPLPGFIAAVASHPS